MGSIGNQNPWSPYDNYKDCSQGICSIYCPQFCYLIFPPPPPSDDDSTPFSPLIIAIIGVLASAFLLVSYYTIVTRYCKRRNDDHPNAALESEESRDHLSRDQMPVGATGLDEALIKMITVCKYKKDEGLIDGTECAVCLSEFQENESLRLLPKCNHAFHLPCIDTWLKSQSNCPLCRANVLGPGPQASPGVNVNTYEIRRPDDLVLVVDDQVRNCGVVSVVSDDENGVGGGSNVINESTGTDLQYRRSVSLSTFSCQRQLLVSDILKIEEIDEDLQQVVGSGIGSSKGLLRSPVAMNRSISTGRFMFTVHDKGKNSLLPN
ncbi:hypothetical protein BUALT_Bualt01G0183900 [Buddleja alternifolia]|uniref:RING-type E3 ubiquitin transferase n=1 Tax=Buddleja alternifolia TaxID=168488 RepID=A0AAV6YFW4_9LAMI|nr:hypothetical protein BUALT_Bualt01G0183900 [Buddleja alternifolia]